MSGGYCGTNGGHFVDYGLRVYGWRRWECRWLVRGIANRAVQDGKEQCILSGLKLILLFAALLLVGCGDTAYPGKPDLPPSISPGWTQKSYEESTPPEGLPEGAQPKCWKALYAGAQLASAEVWACGYRESGSAFDASQRARMGANMVNFQRGKYLAVVRWSGSRTDVTALMRGLESTLGK